MRSSPDWGLVKRLVAKKERNKGDSPYMTMDVADAVPIRLGKFFAAANSNAKKLKLTK